MEKTKATSGDAVAPKAAVPVVKAPPAQEIVLTTQGVGDTGRIVALPLADKPMRERLYADGDALYEYVGDDPKGRRVYRNQARP